MSANQVYTTGEAAKFCNVQKMTVIRWVERGELKAHQLPGRGDRRIRHEDLLEFMQRNEFPLPAEWQAPARPEAAVPAEVPAPGVDILVIEDDTNAAKAIRRVLMNMNLKAEIASDGFRAGSLLETLKPRLVTLDLMMPGMSGFEVLRYIREREDLRQIKVLILSALAREKLQQAMAAGADDVLAKPFHNAELQEKVGKLLGQKAAN